MKAILLLCLLVSVCQGQVFFEKLIYSFLGGLERENSPKQCLPTLQKVEKLFNRWYDDFVNKDY